MGIKNRCYITMLGFTCTSYHSSQNFLQFDRIEKINTFTYLKSKIWYGYYFPISSPCGWLLFFGVLPIRGINPLGTLIFITQTKIASKTSLLICLWFTSTNRDTAKIFVIILTKSTSKTLILRYYNPCDSVFICSFVQQIYIKIVYQGPLILFSFLNCLFLRIEFFESFSLYAAILI